MRRMAIVLLKLKCVPFSGSVLGRLRAESHEDTLMRSME